MAKGRRPRDGDRVDTQVELLRVICTELKTLNERVEQTNLRVDVTNERLETFRSDVKGELGTLRSERKGELETFRSELKVELVEVRRSIDVLGRRVTESELRLATATTQLASDVHTFGELVRDWRDEHRSDRAELRLRIARLEDHVGLEPAR